MNYQTFAPHSDLKSIIKYYWTLEVPKEANPRKQQIVPDGCVEMAFILGDDIKRYISDDDFIIQPRALVLGQQLEPFTIQPVGYVNTFVVSFYAHGLANFTELPIESLVNKEVSIVQLFEPTLAIELEQRIVSALDTVERIKIIESFLFDRLSEDSIIDNIVEQTVEIFVASKGSASIKEVVQKDPSKRRQLERKFRNQIGISPKQLGKIIRFQGALKMLLNSEGKSLAEIATESDYYDQAHFIRDFKEFTGTSPKHFLDNSLMALSSLFYK